MKILFWSEYFWPYIGGSEVFAINLLPALQERGHEFIVVTCHSGSEPIGLTEHTGLRIYRFPFRDALAGRNLFQTMRLCQELSELKRTFRPELVHMNSIGPIDFFHHSTAAAHPSPYVITMQQHIPKTLVTPGSVLDRTLSAAAWVACCSDATLAETRALAPMIASQSGAIHPCVRTPASGGSPLPFDPPTLLCLGRVLDFKGFDLAISAYSRLVAHFPKLRLRIAGNGPALPQLKEQAAALGLENRIEFAGWISPDKTAALFNDATIVLMPSRMEPFGLVALQAADMGRPVVAARVGGLPEIIVNQTTGFLVEKDDALSLADAVAFLLSNPDEAKQMGCAARERARDVFAPERCIDAYDKLYRALSRTCEGGSLT